MKNKVLSFLSLMISDLAVVFLSFILAYLMRSELLPHLFNRFQFFPVLPISNFFNHYYVGIVWISIFAYEKLYTKRFSFWTESKILIKSATLSSAIVMIIIFITKTQIQFSRTIVIVAWLLSLFLFPVFRFFSKILLSKSPIWKKKLIIIGVHETSILILKSIIKNKTMGYEVIGFLDDDPQKKEKIFLGAKVLGTLSELENITKIYKSKDILITTPHLPRKKLKELLSKCEKESESMWLIPRSGDFITEGVEIEIFGEILTLYIKKNLAKPWNIFIKDLYDKLLTLVLVILFLPILFMIAIAIKLDSKGPIIFTQKRLGKYKHMFNLFKFRSMHVNCDEKLYDYLNNNLKAKEEWEKYKKLKNNDPRVTKVGKFIRKYSLDELPQLINVLLGNMSLVGPRPYLKEELSGKDTFKDILARVKPGITGLWQVSGRSELPFSERLNLDEQYIRNWSLWMDITIMVKSIKILFSRKGAY